MGSSTPKIHESWAGLLRSEFEADYFAQLRSFLVDEKSKHEVYPPGSLIFAAFDHTPVAAVKTVIIGQDPYHGQGQAHGLCFSVNDGVRHPPSLQNIFKELRDDLGIPVPRSGNLGRWADSGVLLLNATLTVRAHEAGSHQGQGWERFTDTAIARLSQQREQVAFLLWGSFAQQKEPLIATDRGHLILKAPHPSPFSAHKGFFGCRHFSKVNAFLHGSGNAPIDWRLE
ncbi:MAG: uracil-DNA glycosylase [Flavobacteriales bacterium]|nr:uracil-DNA glycosylase [Flavobacteriales bacterium]